MFVQQANDCVISGKNKCDIDVGLSHWVISLFQSNDTIGFTSTFDCNWFVSTTKLLREFYMFMVGGLCL